MSDPNQHNDDDIENSGDQFGNDEIGNNEFDRDIAETFGMGEIHITMAFTHLYEQFVAMCEVGFTEAQALRFLAFCSIYDGDD